MCVCMYVRIYVCMYVCMYVLCMYVCRHVCVYMYVYNYIFFFCDEKPQNILRLQFGTPEARAPSLHVVRKHTNFPIISGSLFLCYIGNNQS